ncbi:HupE/UreJ family protein [Nodosilinea sp. LEGE 07088]|uniref:HupE/UreJ family protein n=1 Tax=Nodosilinea sp. LEGE 07088 TaxID=2777968 RepID=UPI001880F182|nr:HupE/UreJ family protein [Nodosilinea sp. LEGE 07088]MBE9140815.1 HupE/UreJ family protein [Nodosilinea sp. LEGE 07088]
MFQFQSIKTLPVKIKQLGGLAVAAVVGLLLAASPALAHHPFGGNTPTNAFEGFLSGLGHPVIGLDHLAFVVAAGLLAAVIGRGLSIPISFVLASMAGTGLHLMGLNLPAPEFMISASVLLFGGLLAMREPPRTGVVVALAALAGIFHGYAYGEAVIGAGMGSVLAYLVGFASIQLAIASGSYWLAKRFGASEQAPSLSLRFAGFTLAGVGAAFLSGVVLG